MNPINAVRLTAQFAFLALVPARLLQAQEPPPVTATAVPAVSVIPASAGDTSEIIRTARAADTVRIEKDRFLGERRDAETRWVTLREQGEKLKGGLAEVKDAISAATAKEKQAKKDKRDNDRIFALAEKRQLERSFDLIEARYDLRRAQIDQARIERDYLDASIRANDAELAIAERSAQVPPTDPTQRSVFEELTNRWLQALRTRTARAYDLEDRRFKVVEAQLEMLKRQRR